MTHYSRTLTSEAHYDDRSCARPLFRPAFWFRIAVVGPGGGGDRDDHPPPPLGMWMTSHGQCPRGVFVNVQEWGCFSIFRRADDVTRTMSKGGGGACECLHPPLQEILYPRLYRDPPPKKKMLYPISPTALVSINKGLSIISNHRNT